MNSRARLALAVFVPFTAYSLWVSAQHGPLGFFAVLTGGGWSTQVFLDLVIAMSVLAGVVHRDAKERGINPWPWIVSMYLLGSVGLLAYFSARDSLGRRPEAR